MLQVAGEKQQTQQGAEGREQRRPTAGGAHIAIQRGTGKRAAYREGAAQAAGHLGQPLADQFLVLIPQPPVRRRQRPCAGHRLGEADQRDDHRRRQQRAMLLHGQGVGPLQHRQARGDSPHHVAAQRLKAQPGAERDAQHAHQKNAGKARQGTLLQP